MLLQSIARLAFSGNIFRRRGIFFRGEQIIFGGGPRLFRGEQIIFRGVLRFLRGEQIILRGGLRFFRGEQIILRGGPRRLCSGAAFFSFTPSTSDKRLQRSCFSGLSAHSSALSPQPLACTLSSRNTRNHTQERIVTKSKTREIKHKTNTKEVDESNQSYYLTGICLNKPKVYERKAEDWESDQRSVNRGQ